MFLNVITHIKNSVIMSFKNRLLKEMFKMSSGAAQKANRNFFQIFSTFAVVEWTTLSNCTFTMLWLLDETKVLSKIFKRQKQENERNKNVKKLPLSDHGIDMLLHYGRAVSVFGMCTTHGI